MVKMKKRGGNCFFESLLQRRKEKEGGEAGRGERYLVWPAHATQGKSF